MTFNLTVFLKSFFNEVSFEITNPVPLTNTINTVDAAVNSSAANMTEPVVDSASADNTTATESTTSSEPAAAAEGAAPASAEALESAPTGSQFYVYDFISLVCWEDKHLKNKSQLQHGLASQLRTT